MNDAPQLESCNIILRKPINEDIRARKKLGINRECIKMCGDIISDSDKFTMDDSVKWYERIVQHPCKWVIEYKGNCIGVVGLRPSTDDNKAKFSIEIYDNSVYSCGIGTKVTKMVLNYAFEVLEYHKIYLRVLDYNARAIKCYEKCGFIKEGVDREGTLINGKFDEQSYATGIMYNGDKLNFWGYGLYNDIENQANIEDVCSRIFDTISQHISPK